jgi:hypothetical protein
VQGSSAEALQPYTRNFRPARPIYEIDVHQSCSSRKTIPHHVIRRLLHFSTSKTCQSKFIIHTTYCFLILKSFDSTRISDPPPLDYTTPPFPGLYWPLFAPGVPNYLYNSTDIWRFTLLWTLIIYALFHLAAAALAVCTQLRRGKSALKYVWIIPIVYALIAGIEALLAGSFVGLM